MDGVAAAAFGAALGATFQFLLVAYGTRVLAVSTLGECVRTGAKAAPVGLLWGAVLGVAMWMG